MSPKKSAKKLEFLWGASTASQQVEGHQHNDWSKWEASAVDNLALEAEKRLKDDVPDWDLIKNEATDPANYVSGNRIDSWNRYREDFDCLEKIGCNAYRFSIEWSRIEPKPGKYDEKALNHYAEMIRELKKRGIEPMVTLHHFTNPIWLESRGGWHDSRVAEKFASYTKFVAEKIGKDVKYWVTINEPGSYLLQRYMGGGAWRAWPKTEMSLSLTYKYMKNVVKSHKLARDVIKSINPEAQVGIANAIIDYQLGRHDPLSFIFKKILDYVPNGYWLKRINKSSDFIGVNYYMRMRIKVGLSNPRKWAPKWNGTDPRNDMGWGIYPEGLFNITQRLKKYNLPIFITENGIPDKRDTKRAKYLRDHIGALMRSKSQGADIRGYFYWSLLDNYEWAEGYWPNFGLVAVDPKTHERRIRESAKEYTKIIKQYP